MYKYCCLLALVCLFSFQLLPKTIRLHTIGDSTMEQQNPNVKDQRGWVQMLQGFFTNELLIINSAKSGTSTKSFYRGGYWTKAKQGIQAGDYVLIQFGHNDEKHNGKDGEIGTAPTDSFLVYLTKYVSEVRELGAFPILCSPVVRKMWDKNGQLSRRGKHDLGAFYQQSVDHNFDAADTITMNYSANMKILAEKLQCPFIDMTKSTADLVNQIGNNEATKAIYNLPNDGTHFSGSGALLFSQLFIADLQKQPILTQYLQPQPKLLIYPNEAEINGLFTGTEGRQIIDVGYLGSKSSIHKWTIATNNGFEWSFYQDSGFCKQKEITSHKIAFYQKVYVRIIPTSPGTIKGTLQINDGNGASASIGLKANVAAISHHLPVEVVYKLSGSTKADVKGPMYAFEEQLQGLEFKSYSSPANLGKDFEKTRVQVTNSIGGIWPANEIDIVYNRFVQFGMKASNDAPVALQQLSVNVGGGVPFRIVASESEDFSHTFTIGEAINVTSAEMKPYQYKFTHTIPAGKTLFFRIYPWTNNNLKDLSFNLYQLVINGIVAN